MSCIKRLCCAASLASVLAAGCVEAPQIGADEDAFAGVDALYTAVTTKRLDLLNRCRKNLVSLKSDGKLPAAAFDSLEPIIDQAEKGEWRPAAERLYDFMRQQRKER